MKVKRIEIDKFWDKYNIRWDLNSNVNILTGVNGAGKSTVLDLISSIIIGGKLPIDLVKKVGLVRIIFDNGFSIVNVNFKDSYLNLQKQAKENEILNELKEDLDSELSKSTRKSKLNSITLNASISFVESPSKEKMPIAQFLDKLNIDIVSTFDEPLTGFDDKIKWESLREDGVRSSLDKELHEMQELYSYYIGNLANAIEKMILAGSQPDIDSLKSLYATKNLFISIINELFAQTGKTLDIENSKLAFIIKQDKKPISIYELSSGEKQMLYILWKVLLQDNKPYILVLDEPEISLHIDWQEILITKIKQLNPNCQVIIATHAPSVLLDGWQPYVRNLDDLKNYMN